MLYLVRHACCVGLILKRSGRLFQVLSLSQYALLTTIDLIFSCWCSRSLSFMNVKVIVISHKCSTVLVKVIVFVFKLRAIPG